MSNIEKYASPDYPLNITSEEEPIASADNSGMDVLRGILRRWYIVLGMFVLISGLGIPMVFFFCKPVYRATGAIRVAPVISSILFRDKDSEGVIPMYLNFINTQADLMQSDQVMQRATDELVGKDLRYFKAKKLFSGEWEPVNPIEVLRDAISGGTITIAAQTRGELIKVSVDGVSDVEVEMVANAIMNAYMAVEGSKSTQGGDQTLSILEDKQRVLIDKIQRQRDDIRKLSEEYGTSVLTSRQDMMLTKVADLQAQLTRIETEGLALEAKVQLLEQTIDREGVPDGIAERRYAFIRNDPTILALTQKMAELEEKLVVAKQTLAETNPELKRHDELLDAFKKRLEKRQEELEKTFDQNIIAEVGRGKKDQLAAARAQLEQIRAQEKILQAKLAGENTDTIALGRKQLAIQEQQEQLELTKELYDAVRKRIQELEMERKRPARVSIAYPAASVLQPGKRLKISGMILFAALAAGVFLAFMMEKADRSVKTPNDIIRFIGVPVIGTTTRTSDLNRETSADQVSHDYQNIRANLSLLSGGAIPKKLVITSAAMSEGKSTFSINIATSIAITGGKVLLIDGDLRKPDIARMMKLPNSKYQLMDVLQGRISFQQGIDRIASSGLDVLTADDHSALGAVELLTCPKTAEVIEEIGRAYDHVIIDTPPVLTVPDALLWAKMADAVVLCSQAGQTDSQALKETLARLDQIHVRVIGNVLSNVKMTDKYYRYGHGYYQNRDDKIRRRKNDELRFLLPKGDENGKSDVAV